MDPVAFVGICWALGDKDEAFQLMDKAYEERSFFLVSLKLPMYDALRWIRGSGRYTRKWDYPHRSGTRGQKTSRVRRASWPDHFQRRGRVHRDHVPRRERGIARSAARVQRSTTILNDAWGRYGQRQYRRSNISKPCVRSRATTASAWRSHSSIRRTGRPATAIFRRTIVARVTVHRGARHQH